MHQVDLPFSKINDQGVARAVLSLRLGQRLVFGSQQPFPLCGKSIWIRLSQHYIWLVYTLRLQERAFESTLVSSVALKQSVLGLGKPLVVEKRVRPTVVGKETRPI